MVMLADSAFLEAIVESGLSAIETQRTRQFHDVSVEPVHRLILNGVYGMGHDISGKLRDNDHKRISSHWYRMGEMSLARNWPYINEENKGRYVLRAVLNVIHDIAEERISDALKKRHYDDPIALRTLMIELTKNELCEIIDAAAISSGIRVRGTEHYKVIFGGVDFGRFIDRYFDVFTPGWKTGALGINSAIEVGHNITWFDDEDSLEAALYVTEPKINDRKDNGPNIFPRGAEWHELFNDRVLRRTIAEISKDQAVKEDTQAAFKAVERKKNSMRVIPPERRVTELYKLVWIFSQAAELIDHSVAYGSTRIATARRPVVRAAREALESLLQAAPLHMNALTAYRNMPRKEYTMADGSPLPSNDARLTSYLRAQATRYWNSEAARSFQGESGTAGPRIFDGSFAHMVRVEANIGAERRRLAKNTVLNIARTALIEKMAADWLPYAQRFQEQSDARQSLMNCRLKYLPNLYSHMTKLIGTEGKQ